MLLDLRLIPTFAVAALVALAPAALRADESGRDCTPVCGSWCVKPITIADRWDDVTTIAGHEAWANNGVFDREAFTDGSANGLYDVGEPFEDENGNGSFDQEAYHPALTGYTPDPVPGNVLAPAGDLGRLLRLRPDAGDRHRADAWAAVAFPATNKGTPVRGARAYRDALAGCESAYIEKGDRLDVQPGSMAGPSAEAFATMVAGDPEARWDEAAKSIVGMREPGRSSRLVLIGLHDPRVGRGTGRGDVQLTKIAAFFIEEPGVDGVLTGRFLKMRAPGGPCACDCVLEESFVRDCR
jgi:hypothetical protein